MYEIERDAYTDSHRKGPGCLYWLLWLIANVAAFVIGSQLGELIQDILVQPGLETRRLLSIQGRFEDGGLLGFVAAVAGGLASGTLLGIMQGLVLRPYFKARLARKWLFVTILSGTLRWMAIFLISQSLIGLVVDEHLVGSCVLFGLLALAGSITGIALGLPQSVLLNNRVHHPRWWVLANMAGPVAAALMVGIGLSMEGENIFRDWSVIIAAIVGSAVTGTTLIGMLKHPMPGVEWEQDLMWKPEKRERGPVKDTVLGSTHYGSPRAGVSREGNSAQDTSES